ncbi:glycosyltransferase [Candidatus Pacearchaeota archaeon]|nr:glycosyltransferase [Candidatus Pacearchaeota archaeon]
MKKLIVVIPAYNEGETLKKNVEELYNFLKKNIKNYKWKIIISDNASIDKTLEIAKNLVKKYKKISVVHMNSRAKSLAIKKIWLNEEADIYSFMDADLSADLNYFPQLISGIEKGFDISIGSRTSKQSVTSRKFKRHITSLTLILMIKILFRMDIEDFQCGFKAINKKIRDNIIPKMKAVDHGFMDTEMLAVANSQGYKIKEIPIAWKDDRKSHNKIIAGILDALKNMIRIRIDLWRGAYK